MPPRPPADSARRRASERQGRRAEWIAAWFLRAKGYRILARRVQTPAGEIDLIAAKGDTLVFVEVKARSTLDSGLLALQSSALRRVAAASRLLAPRFAGAGAVTRIDAIVVRPWALPVHLIAIRQEG
jgi:putative endonuclease